MHTIWSHLMDEDFIKGCTDGLTIQCFDNIEQVFYLRIMTYSADYPEESHHLISYCILMLPTVQSSPRHDQKPRAKPLPAVSHSQERHPRRRYTSRRSAPQEVPD